MEFYTALEQIILNLFMELYKFLNSQRNLKERRPNPEASFSLISNYIKNQQKTKQYGTGIKKDIVINVTK